MTHESGNISKEKSIELRSEKVRSIIGGVPPMLTRYGTFILLLVLLIFISISAFIPYLRIINGVVTINDIPEIVSDSIILHVELEMLPSNNLCPIGSEITLITDNHYIQGKVSNYNFIKTAKGKNEAELILPSQKIKALQNSEVEFRLTISESTIIVYFFRSIGI